MVATPIVKQVVLFDFEIISCYVCREFHVLLSLKQCLILKIYRFRYIYLDFDIT